MHLISKDNNQDWNNAPLYWSTILHAQAWFGGDGVRVRKIEKNGGMSPRMLRSIAIEYNVNRGLSAATSVGSVGKRKQDWAAERLCEILHAAKSSWPRGLMQRAELCTTITKEAVSQQCFKNEQVSAVTKYMWFLAPCTWTMFDRFAARGMGIRMGLEPGKRMLDFYRALQESGFESLVHNMQSVIDRTVLRGLPATRVIDTLLMVRGGRVSHDDVELECSIFLELMLPETRSEIMVLGHELHHRFGQTYPRLTAAKIHA